MGFCKIIDEPEKVASDNDDSSDSVSAGSIKCTNLKDIEQKEEEIPRIKRRVAGNISNFDFK